MRKKAIPALVMLFMLPAVLMSCAKSPRNAATESSSPPSQSTGNTLISETTTEDSTAETTVPEKKPLKEVTGMVRIDEMDPDIAIDLKYATADNFTGKKVYPVSVCALTKETAQKLIAANDEFIKDGYRVKIWDAYRPLYVQQIFWDIVQNPQYVADPKYGSSHSTGCTVDMTLVDMNGNEVEMPTAFDDFSSKASRKYAGASAKAKKNLDYLTKIMLENGFTTINSEWWEYRDSDIKKYPQLDISLEEFLD